MPTVSRRLPGWPRRLAGVFAVPFAWDGTPTALPTSARELVSAALVQRRRAVPPTALGALQAVVHTPYRGRGLSSHMLLALADAAARAGLRDLVAAIRPTGKHRHPLTPLARYAEWQPQDGLPRDRGCYAEPHVWMRHALSG
jgi:GNAT superfamily N-acetyltransferase